MDNVLVYGLKESGKACIEALIDYYNVYVYDDNNETLETIYKNYNGQVKKLGEYTEENLKKFSFIVISPSISIYSDKIELAKGLKIKIIGEMELGYNMGVRPLVSVTGSNGKSTTVKLTEHIFNIAGRYAKSVGNIGEPLTKFYSYGMNDLINEVSSFQLETIQEYHTPISVILNITPNHLDRHKDFETYKNEKLKLFSNMSDDEKKIINYDDENLNGINLPETYYFSMKEKVRGVFFNEGFIYLNIKRKIKFISTEELSLKGNHNIQNAMASILICYIAGIKSKYIKQGLRTFKGLKHRIQEVAKKNNIRYIDDSKSTSSDSCLVAVRSFKENIVLLLGGKNKNIDYTEMFTQMPDNVRHIILYGETRELMKINLKLSGRKIPYSECEKLSDAILRSKDISISGDVVLLSPATSSFDEFSCYEERGDYFNKKVQEMLNEKD